MVARPGTAQAAADRFFENYEEVLRGIEARPEEPLPGFAPDTVNCVSLSAMRCASCWQQL